MRAFFAPFLLFVLLLAPGAAAFTVIGTDSQKAFITYNVAPPTGISSSTTECRLGCGGEQQIHGVGMVQKGVFYTLRNKLGLGIGKIIVHGFDLSSKKTVCEIKVPALAHFGDNFATGAYGLQVHSTGSENVVYIIGPTERQPGKNGTEHALVRVDIGAGTANVVGRTVAHAPMAASSTFDHETGVFYFMYQRDEVSLGVRGLAVSNGSTVSDWPTDLYTIDFDPTARKLVGLGLAFTDKGQFRTLRSLDPTDGSATTLLNVTAYKQNLPATVLLPQSRLLVAQLLPQGGEGADLVAFDLANNTLIANPQLCPRYDECPWNLGTVESAV